MKIFGFSLSTDTSSNEQQSVQNGNLDNDTSSNEQQSVQNGKLDNDHNANTASTTDFEGDCTVLGETNSEKIKKTEERIIELLEPIFKEIEAANAERKKEITKLNSELINRKEEISKHNTVLSKQDKEITDLKNSLLEKNEKIKKLDKSINRFESEIESLAIDAVADAGEEKKLTLEPIFKELEAANAERKKEITKLNSELINRAKEILKLNTVLSKQDKEITDLKKSVSEKNENIKKLDKSFNRFESEIESLAIDAVADAGEEKKLTLRAPVTKACFDIMQSAVLETLVLYDCSRLKNEDFNDFNQFKNLRQLTLNKCSNDGLTEVFVNKLPKNSLKLLKIDGLAKVTDDLFKYLPKNLTSFCLNTSCPIEFTNEKMGNFPKTITSLTLYSVKNLNKEGIKNLAKNNPDLYHLNISSSKNITNEALPFFPSKLNGLYLHDCSMVGTSNISELKQITILGIDNWECDKSKFLDVLPNNIVKISVGNDEDKKSYEGIIKQKKRNIEVSNVGTHSKFN